MTAATSTSPSSTTYAADLDAVVIGAGITGLYQLQQLREAGLDARIIEAGDGVGGTWYWNRYPNARFDSESYSYGYLFDAEFYGNWQWSEHFAGQPEIERYLNLFADTFDLKKDIVFDARVTTATFLEDEQRWLITTEDGRLFRTQFLLTAVGIMSEPIRPREPGLEDFQGQVVHTARWPKDEVDFAGKRVAVIGTGSSGVQVIPAVAASAAHLTVLQRSPNWCTPLNNTSITEEEQRELSRAGAAGMIARVNAGVGGLIHEPGPPSALEADERERTERFEALYQSPGLRTMVSNYKDIGSVPEANDLMSQFVAEKIRSRVDDPKIAEMLIPTDHGFGGKRPPQETDYYEVYNRDNVDLVDITATPIERFTARGIQTSERELEFDLIILATGFDFVTGAFDKITFTGRDGHTLKEHWSEGPVTHMGVLCTGLPNLLMIGGAHNAFGNMPRATEITANTAAQLLRHMRENGHQLVETDPELEREWTDRVLGEAEHRLIAQTNSYFVGANVPGKPRRWLVYNGSTLQNFRNHLAESTGENFTRLTFR